MHLKPRALPSISRAAIVLATWGLILVLHGCATPGPEMSPLTVPVERVEDRARTATRPADTVALVFRWRLNDRGSRLEGRGVARLEPPYRVRLDLFTENGETAARAALVGSELRVPAEVDMRLVPPPALLWASLGVLHPGVGAVLSGGEEGEGDLTRFTYRLTGDETARFLLRGRRLESAELLERGHVSERVRLEWEADGNFPTAAVYRDLSEFRELRVELESIRSVASFPPDIWLEEA